MRVVTTKRVFGPLGRISALKTTRRGCGQLLGLVGRLASQADLGAVAGLGSGPGPQPGAGRRARSRTGLGIRPMV